MAEGKTRKEALRCLKRHLARRFHRLLTEPLTDTATMQVHTLPSIGCLTYGDETSAVEAVMSEAARSVAVSGRWGFGGRTQSGQAAFASWAASPLT